ncbi:hypothetical protein L226DRAFT_595160 [Lentinus tigrinus ALCF2SS1-7]|uniref:C2H2-type domain-containing protein n=1 Tax=Lentinus tigrinus ALCF2SS1-6 TaxID=1328759 RepID=A0A5C2RZQ8_9APHY|nr:hypothetical protein L227DRAFT_602950 [Lentinus tigrinus ALCF2SS1-6]RPD79570.1 hypothetical protein L226DRAFT_595160 [Lentinus tigrinus ALCF2SS1-7]
MAPQRTEKKSTGRRSTKSEHCSFCTKWLSGDINRHMLVHTGVTKFYCPEPGCNRSNAPNNKGFAQKSQMITHLNAVHLKVKKPCPHSWICEGVVYPCKSCRGDPSSLNKHRRSAHKWCAGDSDDQVAVPTPCSGDHKYHLPVLTTADLAKYLALASVAPSIVQKQQQRPNLCVPSSTSSDGSSPAPVAPIAVPSSWNYIPPMQQDFGVFPPSPSYGTSSAPVAELPNWNSAQQTQGDFGVLSPSTSQDSCSGLGIEGIDFPTVLANLSDTIHNFDPAFFGQPLELPMLASELCVPPYPEFVLKDTFPVVPPAAYAGAEQGYGVSCGTQQHFAGNLAVPEMYSPSRESTASPVHSPYGDSWSNFDHNSGYGI